MFVSVMTLAATHTNRSYFSWGNCCRWEPGVLFLVRRVFGADAGFWEGHRGIRLLGGTADRERSAASVCTLTVRGTFLFEIGYSLVEIGQTLLFSSKDEQIFSERLLSTISWLSAEFPIPLAKQVEELAFKVPLVHSVECTNSRGPCPKQQGITLTNSNVVSG